MTVICFFHYILILFDTIPFSNTTINSYTNEVTELKVPFAFKWMHEVRSSAIAHKIL